jgi:hypothetical protein
METDHPLQREELESRLAELQAERADVVRHHLIRADEPGTAADRAEDLIERETEDAVLDLLEERIRVVEQHLVELGRAHIHSA